jgi:hypothetical protein
MLGQPRALPADVGRLGPRVPDTINDSIRQPVIPVKGAFMSQAGNELLCGVHAEAVVAELEA